LIRRLNDFVFYFFSGSKIEKEEESISPIKNVSIPVGRDAKMECTITGKFSMESLRVI
jgi:hypothetical protein